MRTTPHFYIYAGKLSKTLDTGLRRYDGFV